MNTWVYALCDSDGSPRYVGSSIRPRQRHGEHCRRNPADSRRKADWLRSLGSSRPRMIILDCVPHELRAPAERRWIDRLAKRFTLVNVQRPGKSPLYLKHSMAAAPTEAESRAIEAFATRDVDTRELGLVIGLALRQTAVELGMTVEEIAQETGASHCTVRRHLAGSSRWASFLRPLRLREPFLRALLAEIERDEKAA